MAYFGKYIRQILAKKETVVFPGFGSLFIKESKGGELKDGRIEPPGAVVVFDPTHPKDNGVLAREYAFHENIDEEEAGQQLLELVDAIKFKLDKGEAYELSLVGKFSRDEDNRIRFRKDPNWIIDPEVFGLSSLEILELDDEQEGEAGKDKTVKEKEPVPDGRKDEKEIVKKPTKRPVKKWTIIWIVIASLITVMVLILLIPVEEENSTIEFGKEGLVIRNTEINPDRNVGTRENERVPTSEEDIPGVRDETRTEVEVPAEVMPVNNHFIIAGSFQNLQNANDLMEELKGKGFPSEMIYTENRLYRVAVRSYATKDQALADLPRIKSVPGLEKVWVWTKE